jgi:hypothetical protein
MRAFVSVILRLAYLRLLFQGRFHICQQIL